MNVEMNVKTVSCTSPTAAKDFAESLRETGFAVLTDHPIPAKLIHNAFKTWEEFFASKEKHNYLFDAHKQSGYFPFRAENAKDSKVKDLKEFYHYYPWGELPTGTEESTRAVYTSLMDFGAELLRWIEANTPDSVRGKFPMPLTDMIKDTQDSLLRPLHYPPLHGSEEEGAVRAAAHEDINLITLLPAATAPGLQVRDVNGKWHEVECDPGTIVVNSGDMLKEASESYYPSTTHRVVNPLGEAARKSRFSMPFFLHPRRDARLSARYTAGDYLAERLREIGLLPKA